jgi:hypothetical protein
MGHLAPSLLPHRRAHVAVTAILAMKMAESRQIFFSNMDSIIANKDGLKIMGRICRRPLAQPPTIAI